MTNFNRRLEKLEEEITPEVGPVFLLVDKAKGENLESVKAAHLAEHPEAKDATPCFVMILNEGKHNDQ